VTERLPLILVVDDDPVNVELLCELLATMDYRVRGAHDGPEALELARREDPDLILLDVMMPGMNGFEVCRRLRSDPVTATTSIVFVTALSDTEDKLKGIEAGGDDFLTKPFNRPILVARIRSLLRLKRAGEELQRSYRKLKELEQLREDLMKMIVHDLKSPLTAILGSLELVVDGDAGPLLEPQRRLLDDARERGDEMRELMDDLLELARLEENRVHLSPAPLMADELLHDVAEEWKVRSEQDGFALHVDAAPAVPLIADSHLVRRVLGNLIGNAVKHAGPGVDVRLSAEITPSADGIRFTVADDGRGIPEAYHQQIFRKYARAPGAAAAERPSGLGLSFCKLAVEAHGGRIWVRSGRPRGSAFDFVLPFRPPEALLTG
jgi:signal transduction histidine kinase